MIAACGGQEQQGPTLPPTEQNDGEQEQDEENEQGGTAAARKARAAIEAAFTTRRTEPSSGGSHAAYAALHGGPGQGELCEHAFVSIKGRPYRWLQDALERGDLAAVRAEAANLPAISLDDALRIALLVADHEPERAQRAALRWLGRFCLERRDVTLAEVRQALDAFTVLVNDPEAAETALRRLAGR
jgi:hypothetical protein